MTRRCASSHRLPTRIARVLFTVQGDGEPARWSDLDDFMRKRACTTRRKPSPGGAAPALSRQILVYRPHDRESPTTRAAWRNTQFDKPLLFVWVDRGRLAIVESLTNAPMFGRIYRPIARTVARTAFPNSAHAGRLRRRILFAWRSSAFLALRREVA